MDEVPGDDGDKDTEEPEALETKENFAEPDVELCIFNCFLKTKRANI